MKSEWRWILARNHVLLVASLVTFVAGVIYEPARWNMLTAAWGTFMGGVLAWMWFEVRGPGFERSVWLRQNGKSISRFLNPIEEGAYTTIFLFVGSDGMSVLEMDSLDLVIEGIARIRSSLPDPTQTSPRWSNSPPTLEEIRQPLQQIREAASHIVLSRLTDLQVRVHAYGERCRWWEYFSKEGVLVEYTQVEFVSAALDLLETVSQIMADCELLPRRTTRA